MPAVAYLTQRVLKLTGVALATLYLLLLILLTKSLLFDLSKILQEQEGTYPEGKTSSIYFSADHNGKR